MPHAGAATFAPDRESVWRCRIRAGGSPASCASRRACRAPPSWSWRWGSIPPRRRPIATSSRSWRAAWRRLPSTDRAKARPNTTFRSAATTRWRSRRYSITSRPAAISMPARIGLWGVSLGGYYAPRAAAFEPRARACMALGGPFAWAAAWEGLPALTREAFRVRSHCASLEDARRHAATLTLEGIARQITCPIYIMNGRQDRIVSCADAERLAREVKGPVTLRIIEDGNHVANNRAYRWRPDSADWMAQQLADSLPLKGGGWRRRRRGGSRAHTNSVFVVERGTPTRPASRVGLPLSGGGKAESAVANLTPARAPPRAWRRCARPPAWPARSDRPCRSRASAGCRRSSPRKGSSGRRHVVAWRRS